VSTAQVSALALGGASLLAACGDDPKSGSSTEAGPDKFGDLNFQLAWLFIAEWAGEYMADKKGFWEDEGFSSSTLTPGGANAGAAETQLVQKNAFAAYSTMDLTATAVLKGAPVKIIGTMYQKSPLCILSMADDPINSPDELIGRKIGVSAGNLPTYEAFLKANGIKSSDITRVPVQNDPLPLTTGVADAWFGYFYNEPAILKQKGFDTTSFLLADFNYPLSGNPIVVLQESIDKERDKVKAMLRGAIRGQKANIADPGAGADLAVNDYGKDLGMDLQEQTTENELAIQLMVTDDTKKNGLYTMSEASIAANLETLALGGHELTADQLFDTSLLQEVYAEDPSLI
jgi:ABC-type nitrate/sulfonate/bicarbonate transport system substrate-binding protein